MSGDEATRYDLVLSGGTVFDSPSGNGRRADFAVVDGRIAAIGPDLGARAAQTIDCTGKYLVPGLVEAHTHIFEHVSAVGAPPDEAHLRRGVVAAADAGTAGASTFDAFRHYIVEPAGLRIVCFLNVSVLGLVDYRFGELLNPGTLVPEDALRVARNNPDIVRGLKIRLSEDVVGERCLLLLERAVALAEDAALPLMVHIGATAAPLPAILERLRPGDVVSHCYSGKPHGILRDGAVLDDVHKARARGVLFDSAHGGSNFSFAVAERAIGEGFLPDVISSDTSKRNWRGPVFDLVTTMAKFLALGVGLADIVQRTTQAPAHLLGLDREGYGALREGGPAHVTVLEIGDEPCVLPDAAGSSRTGVRIEPTASLARGRPVCLVPWRGSAA